MSTAISSPILVNIRFTGTAPSLVGMNDDKELQTFLARMSTNVTVQSIDVYRRAESFVKETTWKQQ